MPVVSRLSALLKVRRSSSIYRSFSALAALIRFSLSLLWSSPFADVYSSFATDGCIFQLETLARYLGDSCAEKEYLLALVDLGRAVLIEAYWPKQRYDDVVRRTELLDAISLQQCVPSPPTQCYLILFLSRAHNGVSIASVGKASIVFAKAYDSFRWLLRCPSRCNIETAYFALLFLIRSLHTLYHERDNTRCPTRALRQLFLSTLYHWLSAAMDELFLVLSGDRKSVSDIVVVELLRSPFYLCVVPYIPTLLSDEIYH